MSKALTIWFTGLPSAGKTTLANALHQKLWDREIASIMIDGDDFRKSFCSDLGFSLDARRENIRRAASMARMVNDSGVTSICSFVSPTQAIRQLARSIIGNDRFIEVYVNTPLEVCMQRDVKGLYHQANLGNIKDLTGVSSPYEAPENPVIQVDTSQGTLPDNIDYLVNFILKKFC
jgi:adenylyl-sulfate kinase